MTQVAANHPKASISSHRLFPAIVALWFATLFGLGFLVLPGHALERIIGASGISAIIPVAAPPLGLTARLLVSLGAGIAGGLAGYAAARAIAPRGKRDEQARARRESRRERAESQTQSLPEARRRRPLSAMADLGPPMDAPVSQEEPVSREPEEYFAAQLGPAEAEIEPAIELDAIEIVVEELPQADAASHKLPASEAEPEAVQPKARTTDELNLPSDPDADLSRMGVVQLAERLGIAMQRRATRPQSPPPAALAELATYLTGARPAASPPSARPTPSAEPVASASQDPVAQQVVSAPIALAPVASVAASPVEPLAAAERILGRASTASEPEPASVPARPRSMTLELESFGEEEYDDENDVIASLSLPLAGLTPQTAPLEDEAEEIEEEAGEDDSYSSLLAMRIPQRVAVVESGDMAQEPVAVPSPEAGKPAQVSEMPVPTGPAPTGDVRPFSQPIMTPSGRPWADRAETERVLRNALAAIQRKTGAA